MRDGHAPGTCWDGDPAARSRPGLRGPARTASQAHPASSADNPGGPRECSISQSAGNPAGAACKRATSVSAEHTRREAGVPALAGSAAREHRRSRPAIAPGSVKDTSHRQAGRHGPEGAETLNTRRAREDAPRPADGGVSRQETAGPGPPHSGAPGGQRGGGARLPPTADAEGSGPRREDPAHYVISLAFSFFLKTPGWSDFIVHAFRESR